ncbi:hypothetical protein KSP40_PGU019201 [Platanthera guangdongensis]|uniref:Protein kinase domain-containing protein n=1 Tax=Platanthera guangdongensis TaxID=2320717 RepID=A0ABR2M7B2_9ASPA
MVEMATGNSPWPESTDPASVINQIALSSDVPAISEWVSDEMKDFVSKCLIQDPKQRWTAEELLRPPYIAEAEETEESPIQLYSSSKQGK